MSINRGRKRRDDSPAEQEEPSTDARPNTRPPVTHGDPSGHEDQWQMVATTAPPAAGAPGGQGEEVSPPHVAPEKGPEVEGVVEGTPATGKGGAGKGAGAGKGGAGKGKGEAGAGKGKGADSGGKGKGGAGKGGAGKGGAGKGDGAGKGGAGKGSGGKGRGGWVEARVNITAGSRNKYIGGAVTKINYLKITLLQSDNPLVRHNPPHVPHSALTRH
jgi:hypothetical protein